MPYIRPSQMFSAELDDQLANPNHFEAFEPTMFKWSRSVREAIGLPMAALAKRMELTQPAITKLEQNEAVGTISIERLAALADALDCDLVYGFVPREPFLTTTDSVIAELNKARRRKRKLPKRA